MADNPSDNFDSHPESSEYSNDDFEKVGFTNEGDTDDGEGPNAAGSGAYDYQQNQDAEITTTTDLIGEEEAEEDRYGVGASEAEAYGQSSGPNVSGYGDYDVDEDEEETLDQEDDPSQVQPSAPVPEIIEPLIDFSNTADEVEDSSSFVPSAPPPSSHFPEPIPTSSSYRPFDDKQSVQETRSKPVEQTSSGSDKGTSWLKGVDPRETKQAEADTQSYPPVFKDLIYWRDVKKTGIVFGTMFVILLSLTFFSLLSVVSYLSLAVLTVTFSFFLYKRIMGAVQKSNEDHPFKQLLDIDINLDENKLRTVITNVLKNINCLTNEVRRLFLVQDIVDSIKFGLLLWVFTYIGSWFNGMTLIIIALVLLFTLPKVYETYQVQIDNYVGMAKAQINKVFEIVQSKVPFLKKKAKAQ